MGAHPRNSALSRDGGQKGALPPRPVPGLTPKVFFRSARGVNRHLIFLCHHEKAVQAEAPMTAGERGTLVPALIDGTMYGPEPG